MFRVFDRKKKFSSSRFFFNKGGVRINEQPMDFSSCLLLHPRALSMHPRLNGRAAARRTQMFSRARDSHFTRPLFHVRCVFKPSRGIENATNPRHKIPLSSSFFLSFSVGNTSCILVFGGRSAFFRAIFFRAPIEGCATHRARKKTTQTEAKECISRNHRALRAFTASRVHRIRARFPGIFFSSSSRERENHHRRPNFAPETQKKRLKKTSKSALSSSDANTRFQNKRRVVIRKTYHGARLHRDGFADEGGLLDVSGSEHFFCEFFACKIVRSLALLYLLFLLFFSFLGRANEKTGRRKGSRKKSILFSLVSRVLLPNSQCNATHHDV